MFIYCFGSLILLQGSWGGTEPVSWNRGSWSGSKERIGVLPLWSILWAGTQASTKAKVGMAFPVFPSGSSSVSPRLRVHSDLLLEQVSVKLSSSQLAEELSGQIRVVFTAMSMENFFKILILELRDSLRTTNNSDVG